MTLALAAGRPGRFPAVSTAAASVEGEAGAALTLTAQAS